LPKYGTDLNTCPFAYNVLGLMMVPEAPSLREYKMIFISANRPVEIESFRASCKGSVQEAMVSTMVVEDNLSPLEKEEGGEGKRTGSKSVGTTSSAKVCPALERL
jgi:hypothetical protein